MLEYEKEGAIITDDISEADVILGEGGRRGGREEEGRGRGGREGGEKEGEGGGRKGRGRSGRKDYHLVFAGVKRPTLDNLIPNKTYFFFSHTIKAQPENMDLLDAALEKVPNPLNLEF
jgi:hypothetical protein